MTTRTKCTIALCILFIIEIFPLPFTAGISIYVARRRPKWFPNVVARLYADKVFNKPEEGDPLLGADAMKTRSKCTYFLVVMFILDLALPTTIPLGLYIVRRRPRWFKNVSARLYSDMSPVQHVDEEDTFPAEIAGALGELDKRPDVAAEQLKKHLELERDNFKHANFTAHLSATKAEQNNEPAA